MRRALSVLTFILVASSRLAAQALPDGLARAAFVVRVPSTNDVARHASKQAVVVDSGPSHAMRNGAIVGAVVGATAGVVGSTYIQFGCLTSPATSRACSPGHSARVAMIALGAVGGLSGALVGAVTGKLVSLTMF